MRHCFNPVSYTHLDVYKRQEYVPVEDYHLWSRLIVKTQFYIIQESLVDYRIHDSNISQTKIDNVKRSNPVSYTHLDVYKRQIEYFSVENIVFKLLEFLFRML